MPAILDLIEPTDLDGVPPRSLPIFFLPNLIGEHLIERPARSYFDPFLIGALITAVALILFKAPPIIWALLALTLALRLSRAGWRLYRDVRDDYRLLRYGVITNAHVLGVRTSRDSNGDLVGAFVDCAIPFTRRRSSVGSVWMPDAA